MSLRVLESRPLAVYGEVKPSSSSRVLGLSSGWFMAGPNKGGFEQQNAHYAGFRATKSVHWHQMAGAHWHILTSQVRLGQGSRMKHHASHRHGTRQPCLLTSSTKAQTTQSSDRSPSSGFSNETHVVRPRSCNIDREAGGVRERGEEARP